MAKRSGRQLLEPGQHAPGFELLTLAGNPGRLGELLETGPLVLAFFKISCPVCQFTFPYLDRLTSGTGVRIIGISQDDAEDTGIFVEQFCPNLEVFLDLEDRGYPVSNAYGISHVPTTFVVAPDGIIRKSWTGFSRADLEELGQLSGASPFRSNEVVPAWKAG